MDQNKRKITNVNECVAFIKQCYNELNNFIPIEDLIRKRKFNEKEKIIIKPLAVKLRISIEAMENEFQDILMKEDFPLARMDKKLGRFYTEFIHPNAGFLKGLIYHIDPVIIPGLEMDDVDATHLGNKINEKSIDQYDPDDRLFDYQRMIEHAVDSFGFHIEMGNTDYFLEDYEEAKRFFNAKFIQLDLWASNLRKLKPLLTTREIRSPHVKNRLMEIYRSFIFGNYWASISLARSLLEYMLIDSNEVLNLNPYFYDQKKNKEKQKGIGSLVNRASKKLPKHKDGMEKIVEAANNIMHPVEPKNAPRMPIADPRQSSLNCINALVNLIEELYAINKIRNHG